MIDCCVVDDHHDIVPFILSCIRSKRIPSRRNNAKDHNQNQNTINKNDVLMIHIDSHPDFSLPSKSYNDTDSCMYNDINNGYNVNEWSNYDNLNDILNNSNGGIAEFILPLVYNNYFTKVIWIKPKWSTQFDNGYINFNIGNNITTNTAAVTYKWPYYVGESIICNENNMKNDSIKSINLFVSTDSIDDNNNDIFNYIVKEENNEVIPWCLDICLDYFSTTNPFMNDIIENISNDIKKFKYSIEIPHVDNNDIIVNDNNSEYLSSIEQTIDNVMMILKKYFEALRHTNMKLEEYNDNQKYISIINTTMNSIINGYDKIKQSKELLDIIENEFHVHISNFEKIYHLFSLQSKAIIYKLGPMLMLPHHVSTDNEIEQFISNFKSLLIRFIDKLESLPLVITIARSSDDDEYTPRSVVDSIQNKVINVLKELITPNDLKIHDLCDESWCKSYSIFFNERIKRQKII